MDGSLSGLRTVVMKAGAVIFFEDINSGLSVGVSGLVSSTLSELQAIALVLECVPSSCAVDLFLDSQVVLDACKLELLLAHPDFRNCCWIEHCYIANVVYHKNLTVNWIKVKSHLDILGNKRVDELTKNAVLSTWHLPHLVSECFLRAGDSMVSGNSRHFVRDSSLVWHPDSHLAAGFTSACTVGLWTYFMKSLYYRLPIAVYKCLYDKCYPSVVCLFCDDVEFLDHVFVCPFDAAGCAQLLNLLSSCFSDTTISITLYKGFVFDDWYCEFFLVFKNAKIRNRLILHNGSIPALVSGLPMVLSAGVIRLLGVVEAFGIGFSFYKPCLFFSGIGDFVSIRIGT
ncbi:hypothetical protein G9A89_010758 [Geosiphon pyriformis]|nr:hypothetical protein G9A89_010758 [Geosiphon pyriformis]